MRARVAWSVVGLSVVALVLDTAFTAAHRPLLSEETWADHGWPFALLTGAGCAVMGALVISRHPRHPLGWLLCVGSLISVTRATEAYSVWVLDGDGPGSPYWAHVSAWVSSLVGWPAFTAVIMIFFLSPDGHLLSPRWRWAVGVTLTGLGLHTLGTLTISPGEFVYGEEYGNTSPSGPLLNVGVALVAAGLVASVVSLTLRLRTARDDLRRQLLWIVSSAAALAFGVIVVLAVQGDQETWVAALPLHVAYLAFPLCVAVAVLRHRLMDIDVIVNRALLLTLATALVAVGYVLVVVLVGLAIGGSADRFWPSLLATAVVAMAFQPLRGRVVRVADRLAFGAAAAPYEALADLSRRLRDSPDPADLLPAVADAAAHAVNAARATALLHVDAGPDRSAVWPPHSAADAAASRVEIPVADRGERLGSITIEMRAGHPLRPREQKLLAHLADQAGLGFRNARLTAELSGEVDQLSQRNDELIESRRRLVIAGDAERSRLERSIGRQVVRHLEPLPGQLVDLSHLHRAAGAELDAATISPLVDSLNTALEGLREITRGVFPAQLARSGLEIALGSLMARAGPDTHLAVRDSARGRRFEPGVEAAAYFCALEAVQGSGNAATVTLGVQDEHLHLVITHRERDELPSGPMHDRVEAAGGTLSTTTTSGQTVVEILVPVPERSATSVVPA